MAPAILTEKTNVLYRAVFCVDELQVELTLYFTCYVLITIQWGPTDSFKYRIGLYVVRLCVWWLH